MWRGVMASEAAFVRLEWGIGSMGCTEPRYDRLAHADTAAVRHVSRLATIRLKLARFWLIAWARRDGVGGGVCAFGVGCWEHGVHWGALGRESVA